MKVQDMVIRRLEIIGEAGKKHSEHIKREHATSPGKASPECGIN